MKHANFLQFVAMALRRCLISEPSSQLYLFFIYERRYGFYRASKDTETKGRNITALWDFVVSLLFKHYAMKAYGGLDVQSHIFLTSPLAGGELSASHSGRFTPKGRAHETLWIRGGRTTDRVWTTWRKTNSSACRDSNFDPSVVQPVASRYTDCAFPAPRHLYFNI
jgi:hypothetical protein